MLNAKCCEVKWIVWQEFGAEILWLEWTKYNECDTCIWIHSYWTPKSIPYPISSGTISNKRYRFDGKNTFEKRRPTKVFHTMERSLLRLKKNQCFGFSTKLLQHFHINSAYLNIKLHRRKNVRIAMFSCVLSLNCIFKLMYMCTMDWRWIHLLWLWCEKFTLSRHQFIHVSFDADFIMKRANTISIKYLVYGFFAYNPVYGHLLCGYDYTVCGINFAPFDALNWNAWNFWWL